ncbi:MAG: glycosyltransferase family 4 protein [Patescibacteria group bacterium]
MKIAYLTSTINPKSGWGRYASDLISGVQAAGHETVVYTEDESGIRILSRGWRLFQSAWRLRPLLAKYDIIHALDLNQSGMIVALANSEHKKFVLTALGTYSIAPLYHWKTKWISRWALNKADFVVAISKFTQQELLKVIPTLRTKVINPGINLEKFRQTHEAQSGSLVLSVGAIKARKGYHISIPAFLEAYKQLPHLQYVIVGSQRDQAYMHRLKNIIKTNDGEGRVIFKENISDEELKELYRKAVIFLLTSINEGYHFEGFGLVFLEVAAAGLPVIGTLGNGIEDAVKDGYNGLLVPQNDISATTDALLKLVGDMDLWKRYSNASYEWAKKHTMSKAIQSYLEVYAKLK